MIVNIFISEYLHFWLWVVSVVSQQLCLPGWGEDLLQSVDLHGVLVGRGGDGEEAGGLTQTDQPTVGGRHVGPRQEGGEGGGEAHTAHLTLGLGLTRARGLHCK